jgi:hypothetical protein
MRAFLLFEWKKHIDYVESTRRVSGNPLANHQTHTKEYKYVAYFLFAAAVAVFIEYQLEPEWGTNALFKLATDTVEPGLMFFLTTLPIIAAAGFLTLKGKKIGAIFCLVSLVILAIFSFAIVRPLETGIPWYTGLRASTFAIIFSAAILVFYWKHLK